MNKNFQILILFLLIFAASLSKTYSQCTPNTLAFNGSQPIYNTACGNNSYQTLNGSAPSGSGQTYRWEFSFRGQPYTTIVNGSNAPVTTSSLSKNDITNYVLTPKLDSSGDYRIRRIVTDASPTSCSNISEPVFLYYSQSSANVSGGTISGQGTVCAPASGTLTLSGHTGPVLRWESAPASSGPWTAIDSTRNTFTYSNLTSSTCYRALVDNICDGNAGSMDPLDKYSTTVCITVNSVPVVSGPVSQGVCVGSSFTLYVTATSVLTPEYQWRKDGVDIFGAVSSSFTVTNAGSGDAGSYDVIVTNSCGSTISGSAAVTVNPTPVVTAPGNSTVCPGATVPATNFTSTPSGAAYTWTNSNTAIGLPASGTGNVSSFTATNSSTSAITATITVTPVLNGCTGPSFSYTITVKPLATVTVPANLLTVCSGATVPSADFTSTPAGATYTWTNSNTAIGLSSASGTGNVPSFTATNTTSSPVTATITVIPTINGCTGTSSTYTITVNPLPVITSATAADETVCGKSDGTITISATGSAPLEYSINGGDSFSQNGGNFTGLAAGSYSVAVRNLTGCIIIGPILSVSSPGAPPTPVVSPVSSTVCVGEDLTLTITNPQAGAIYTWKGPMGYNKSGSETSRTIPKITASMAGEYGVTATVTGCVSDAYKFNIAVNPLPAVTVPANLTYCAGSPVPASSFTSTPAGAKFTWTNSDTSIGLAGSGTGDIPPFTATNTTSSRVTGTITVTPTLNGCAGPSSSYTISVDPLPVAVISGSTAICYGETATLTVNLTGTPPWNITYTDGTSSVTRTGITASPFTFTVSPNSTKTYTISSVSDAGSCSASGSGSATVTQSTAPLGATFSKTDVNCSGSATGSVSYTITGGTAPYKISYVYNSTVPGSFTVSGSGPMPDLPAGSYEVTLTDANNCTPIVQTIIITQPAALSGTAVSANVTCFGANNGTITISPSGGYGTYEYSIDGGASWQSGATFTGLAPATYHVQLRDAANPACLFTVNASLRILQPSAALSGTTAFASITCFGANNGTITISPSGGYGTYEYSIDGGASWQSGATFTGLAPATYHVQLRDAANPACLFTVNGSLRIQQPSAALSGTAASANVTCFGANNGMITISPSGGYGTYEYSIDGGTSWQSGATFTGLAPATYHVQLRDAANPACLFTVNGSLRILQPSAALSGTAASANVTCFGANNGTITISPSGGYGTYEYSIDGGTSWQSGATFTGLAPATYNVQLRDAANPACLFTVNASLRILQPSAALSGTAASVNVTCFGADNGTITISPSGGYGTYEYSIDGGTSWQSGATFTGLAPATYNVQLRDASQPGCIKSLNSGLEITQPAELTLTAFSPPVLCSGGSTSVVLIAQGGTGALEYRLGNGGYQSSNTFTGVTAGSYPFWVKDINGCEKGYNVNISEPLKLKLAANATVIQCNGTSVVTLLAGGGTGNYQFKNGMNGSYQVSNSFSVGQGSYTFYVTDGACEATVRADIAGVSTLGLTASFTPVPCFGGSSTVTLAASGGTGDYKYKYDNGLYQSSGTFSVTAGNHVFAVQDSRGCEQFFQLTIPEPEKLNVVLTKLKDASCFGTSGGSLDIKISGEKGPVTIIWNKDGQKIPAPADLNALYAGRYSVQVTDGCTSLTSNEIIIEPSSLAVALRKIKDADCTGSSTGALELKISGIVGKVNQLWTKDGMSISTPADLSALPAGRYRVTVKDSCNTVQSAEVIIEPAALRVDFYKINDANCRGSADGGIGLRIFNSTGSVTVSWFKNDITIPAPPDLRLLGAGTYYVQVFDFCSRLMTEKITISEPGVLKADITARKDIACFGDTSGSADLTVSGGTAPYRYLWSNGSTSQDLAGAASGTYSVTVTDFNNCTVQQSVTIAQTAAPLSLAFTKTDVSCFGNSNGSISVSVSGGTAPYTYKWSDGKTAKELNGLPAAAYIIMVTDAKGCTAAETITINQPASALALTFTKNNVSCFGEKNGSINITVTGGAAPYAYTWSNSKKTEDVSDLAPDSYTVTVIDANGCSISQTIAISQPSAVLKALLTVKHTVCKTSDDGMITATVTGGTQPYTIAWKGQPQITNEIRNLAPGTYELLVTDASGCTFMASAEVLAGNCPPVSVDDRYTTDEEVAVTGSAALNDFDRQGETLTFTMISSVKNGKIIFTGGGNFTYSPNTGFWGTETFTYRACNTSGLCDTAIVTINVIPYTVVSLTPETSNVREGKKGVVTARLMRPFKDDVVITISYTGSAVKNRDYVLLDQFQKIRISKGKISTTEKITVAALTDDLREGNEDVILQISGTSDPLVRIGNGAVVVISDIYPSEPLPVTPVNKEIPLNPDIKPDPLISPNGDNRGNEFFKIENIVSFPGNEVVIFNRWGNEVFRLKGYNESDRVFTGFANTGLITNRNSPLPDGVYYYLITTNRTISGKVISALNKGYLILKR